MDAFTNEPELDFAHEENRRRFREALSSVRAQFGRSYPLLIDGETITTSATLTSTNPAQPREVLGHVARADIAAAERSVAAAVRALAAWRSTLAEDRAGFLFQAAAAMRARRLELAAWIVFEAGKPWREADADVCEAIDFLVYYGREMTRLAAPLQLGALPGETNSYAYQSRGVAVVIAPWNFPL